MRSGGSSPIPFEELVEVSAATIAVEEAIAGGKSVWLGGDRFDHRGFKAPVIFTADDAALQGGSSHLRVRDRHLDLIRKLAFLSELIQGCRDVEVGSSALDRGIGEGGVGTWVGIYLRKRSCGSDSAVYVVADSAGLAGSPRESDAVPCGLDSAGAESFPVRRV